MHRASTRTNAQFPGPRRQRPESWRQMIARMHQQIDRVEAGAQAWAIRHGIVLLRLSTGLIFLAFGILKFFPNVSPAESLATATLSRLTVGLVRPGVGIILIASLETVIGGLLITGRKPRLVVWLLCIELVGILSPLVLLPGRLFTGPDHAPNIVGQYVLKDLILAAVVIVFIATHRGARLVGEPSEDLARPVEDPDSHSFNRARASGQ
jgi:putative oxidoreductase